MKKTFSLLFQKCICLDYFINTLMNNNYYNYINVFDYIRNENLKNIKLLYHINNILFNDSLLSDKNIIIDVTKDSYYNFNYLLNLNLYILSDLRKLKKCNLNLYSKNILNNLNTSYSKLTSYTQLLYNITTYNSVNNCNLTKSPKNRTCRDITSYINSLREICINSLNIFFDFLSFDNDILEEHYETFFENDSNKYYQFFFKDKSKIYKAKIIANTKMVFYIYQNFINPPEILPHLKQSESKDIVDKFLKDKLKYTYNNLYYDKNYINIFEYEDLVESYKFKYNYKNISGKINFNKGFYISINTTSLLIEEISIFNGNLNINI